MSLLLPTLDDALAGSPRTIDLGEGALLQLFEGWLGEAERRALYDELSTAVPWRHETIRMFGREVLQPRLTAAFADEGVSYRYSGLVIQPSPWSAALSSLKARAERDAGGAFNYALANLYRAGNDAMGFHADDEAELGRNPLIASVSLGAARRFVLRHRREPRREELLLTDGSLLVMAGTTQHRWLHGVPRTARPVGPRINLTFRRIVA